MRITPLDIQCKLRGYDFHKVILYHWQLTEEELDYIYPMLARHGKINDLLIEL